MSEIWPFIVIGISVGSVYGLAGTGLVLQYKTSGIFNFAYGALATVSVFVFYWLHVQNGWPWPLITFVLILLLLGPVMGDPARSYWRGDWRRSITRCRSRRPWGWSCGSSRWAASG